MEFISRLPIMLCRCQRGRTDYVGAFVVTAGVGAEYLHKKFEEEGDTYNAMLLQTLTDRLAEATAEYLHEKVRKTYWGYVPDEDLSVPDLFKVKYQGIRPGDRVSLFARSVAKPDIKSIVGLCPNRR